ncbi:hypothetical protein FACS1894208_02630 [Clostridia bacterium]|nr:hypothetical protein FACS1894208_02630 [Clostridia bacterium]
MPSEFIFYGGLVVAGAALIAGLLAIVILSSRWKRLSAKLDTEYGKKRR